jgi:glucosamine--fructose-6-phosphate aminotransferase (isomerizing)
MCGIVGYVGTRESIPILLEGLERLEYRGYDSAGIAVQHGDALTVCKAKGKVSALRALDLPYGVPGPGIGHTRWATHGEPSDDNAHPHVDQTGRIAVVHNGIIENASLIRERLVGQGVVFTSDTDSEVLPHLIAAAAVDADDLAEAVRQALAVIEGTYGIAVLDTRDPGCIVVARNGSPVVIGVGNGENFIASDTAAIVR